jgi:hypothetical protein
VRFMNIFDISRAAHRHADHEVTMAAVETLWRLMEWADSNSDGWAYWPKPARSAARLMELVEGDGTWQAAEDIDQRATPAAYRKACAPIKAFLTRQGVSHDTIIVPLAAASAAIH